MPFGEDLRADEDIDFACLDARAHAAPGAFVARTVAVDAQHARLWKVGGERGFDALSALPDRRQIGVAAVGTSLRCRGFIAAVMAVQAAITQVQNELRAAAVTIRQPAAIVAQQRRRVTTTVDKNQHLLFGGQASGDGSDQRRCKTILQAHVARWYTVNSRRRVVNALGQLRECVAIARGVVPGFQRGCGGAQHNRHATLARPHHRQIARGVAKAVALFKRRIVFLVDNNQPQFRQRCKHCQPRAQHDTRGPRLRSDPVLEPFAFVQPAVQTDDLRIGKAPAHGSLKLWRERYLGHQQQGLTALFQNRLDGAQVHLCFSAAGDTQQQMRHKQR